MTDSPSPDASPTPAQQRHDRCVTAWMIAVIAMVCAMVVLGGLTRLTQSGLSMVDWNPIMGALPPMTAQAWEDAFAAYKAYPEYQQLNYGMTLFEFQEIFWMEYTHRVWGRLIGIVYILPFAWFLWRGRVRGRLALHLWAILGLGAAQGLMGWVMVKSGLVDRPSVSAYRLTAHLALAVAIYLWLLWLVLGRVLRRDDSHMGRPLARPAGWALGLALTTLLSGGFVAGLDAGLTYNTFPLMDGHLVPPGLLDLSPVWRNPFENIAMVQFDHRMLAIITVGMIGWLWVRAQGQEGLLPRARLAAGLACAMGLIQPMLGIATLLLVVPVALGVLHQAGALALTGLLVWTLREAKGGGAPA